MPLLRPWHVINFKKHADFRDVNMKKRKNNSESAKYMNRWHLLGTQPVPGPVPSTSHRLAPSLPTTIIILKSRPSRAELTCPAPHSITRMLIQASLKPRPKDLCLGESSPRSPGQILKTDTFKASSPVVLLLEVWVLSRVFHKHPGYSHWWTMSGPCWKEPLPTNIHELWSSEGWGGGTPIECYSLSPVSWASLQPSISWTTQFPVDQVIQIPS